MSRQNNTVWYSDPFDPKLKFEGLRKECPSVFQRHHGFPKKKSPPRKESATEGDRVAANFCSTPEAYSHFLRQLRRHDDDTPGKKSAEMFHQLNTWTRPKTSRRDLGRPIPPLMHSSHNLLVQRTGPLMSGQCSNLKPHSAKKRLSIETQILRTVCDWTMQSHHNTVDILDSGGGDHALVVDLRQAESFLLQLLEETCTIGSSTTDDDWSCICQTSSGTIQRGTSSTRSTLAGDGSRRSNTSAASHQTPPKVTRQEVVNEAWSSCQFHSCMAAIPTKGRHVVDGESSQPFPCRSLATGAALIIPLDSWLQRPSVQLVHSSTNYSCHIHATRRNTCHPQNAAHTLQYQSTTTLGPFSAQQSISLLAPNNSNSLTNSTGNDRRDNRKGTAGKHKTGEQRAPRASQIERLVGATTVRKKNPRHRDVRNLVTLTGKLAPAVDPLQTHRQELNPQLQPWQDDRFSLKTSIPSDVQI